MSCPIDKFDERRVFSLVRSSSEIIAFSPAYLIFRSQNAEGHDCEEGESSHCSEHIKDTSVGLILWLVPDYCYVAGRRIY